VSSIDPHPGSHVLLNVGCILERRHVEVRIQAALNQTVADGVLRF